ncbi:hypothetical protein [Methanooceanicella nereidis]|uniref:hypothetical protein n=1 Tax=Methanooceanicella nereidis TaxID=2052831 RepID=UPI001E5FFE26|nr:hypothetical protein [Methanocella sp. CWC-04]
MDGFLSLGELLLESGKYEEASFSIHFAKQFGEQYTGETFQRPGGWLSSGIRNWGHTDVLCSEVLSRFSPTV